MYLLSGSSLLSLALPRSRQNSARVCVQVACAAALVPLLLPAEL